MLSVHLFFFFTHYPILPDTHHSFPTLSLLCALPFFFTHRAEHKKKWYGLLTVIYGNAKKNGIVFCNFKDSLHYVSDYLTDNGIDHVSFYGGLDQIERERALIKFRNGSAHILLATDLAARGIDVPELDYIVHYQLPPRAEEFTHRNGRTARMHASGSAYVLAGPSEKVPAFIDASEAEFEESGVPKRPEMVTLSPFLREKIYDDAIPGFTSIHLLRSLSHGGVAIRTLSIISRPSAG